MLVSQVNLGLLDYLLNGCIRLTSDGESGLTRNGRLGMPGVSTVWGRHIDREGTIIAESLSALSLTLSLGGFVVGSELGTSINLSQFLGVSCNSWGVVWLCCGSREG